MLNIDRLDSRLVSGSVVLPAHPFHPHLPTYVPTPVVDIIVAIGMWFDGEMTGEGKYEHATGEVYTGQVRIMNTRRYWYGEACILDSDVPLNAGKSWWRCHMCQGDKRGKIVPYLKAKGLEGVLRQARHFH